MKKFGKAGFYHVLMHLSDNTSRYASSGAGQSVLTKSMAELYKDFVGTHGFARKNRLHPEDTKETFGRVEELRSQGIYDIKIVIRIELIPIET